MRTELINKIDEIKEKVADGKTFVDLSDDALIDELYKEFKIKFDMEDETEEFEFEKELEKSLNSDERILKFSNKFLDRGCWNSGYYNVFVDNATYNKYKGNYEDWLIYEIGCDLGKNKVFYVDENSNLCIAWQREVTGPFGDTFIYDIIEVLEHNLKIERIANLANNGIDFETYIDKEVLLSEEIEEILFEKNII